MDARADLATIVVNLMRRLLPRCRSFNTAPHRRKLPVLSRGEEGRLSHRTGFVSSNSHAHRIQPLEEEQRSKPPSSVKRSVFKVQIGCCFIPVYFIKSVQFQNISNNNTRGFALHFLKKNIVICMFSMKAYEG